MPQQAQLMLPSRLSDIMTARVSFVDEQKCLIFNIHTYIYKLYNLKRIDLIDPSLSILSFWGNITNVLPTSELTLTFMLTEQVRKVLVHVISDFDKHLNVA